MNRGPSFDASLSDEETVEFSEEGTSNSAQEKETNGENVGKS